MPRNPLPFLLTILLCVSMGGIAASQDTKPLTNQDVTSMVKSLLPETVILSAIKTNQTNFDVSANGLIALKKAGVSAKVMQAMLDAASTKKGSTTASDAGSAGNAFAASAPGAPAPGVMPAPAWQPTVLSAQGSTKVNLAAEGTYIVQTKTKPTSLAALATDKALNDTLQAGMQTAQQKLMTKASGPMALAAMNPGVAVVSGLLNRRAQQSKMTYVWALTGGNAAYSLSGEPPSFEVNYAGLPGVNPDEFLPVIVKLVPTPQATFRLVGATEATSSAGQSTTRDWPIYSSFVEEHIDAKVDKISPGHARMKPAAALAAGEYAIALRPVDKSHRFSGEEIEKNQAEGLLFNYAWSFSVK